MRAWWRLMNDIGIGKLDEGGSPAPQINGRSMRPDRVRRSQTVRNEKPTPRAISWLLNGTRRVRSVALARASPAATSRPRIQTAAERDAAAVARDERARRKDARAQESDSSIAASDVSNVGELEGIRARSAASRVRAAADREMAAQDRAEAADERSSLEAELNSAHLDDLTGAFHRGMARSRSRVRSTVHGGRTGNSS